MRNDGRIITVGVSPAWDVTCLGERLEWGRHAIIDEQVVRPAGKAMNVSFALAWMGCPSVAAGLWGREDHDEMTAAVARLGGLIESRMTVVEGRTRRNIAVVDTLIHREMHLRDPRSLASVENLRRLGETLSGLIRPGDLCVFSGAMPGGELLEPIVDLVRICRRSGAQIVVDTYGPVFKAVVDTGLAWLISPNVEELRELVGSEIEDSPAALAEAARGLLDRAQMVRIGRGEKGALLVTKAGAWTGCATDRNPALSTVGCGDYLLAGFLVGLRETGDPRAGLTQGLKASTARAWGWSETRSWLQAQKEVAVAVTPL
ncbi:MAG TPA: PfkB family carbohydrate kinase [Sedimentisphaerales bacterium]|nr:PfkB family carbohydrate kinase [Sedimentisphaerales bacterium]